MSVPREARLAAIAVQVEQHQAQFGLAVEVEMFEGPAQVGLDRLRREPQLAGDLSVGPAADRQPGDLALPRRQAGQGVLGLLRASRSSARRSRSAARASRGWPRTRAR
jgi:hypothetical protein